MFCPKCGAKNADTASFCGMCGAQLPKIPTPAVSQSLAAPPKKQTRKKKPLVLAAVAAALALVILTASVVLPVFRSRSYEETVKLFMDGLIENDGKKMLETLPMEALSTRMKQEGFDEDEMEGYVRKLNRDLGIHLGYVEDSFGVPVSWKIVQIRESPDNIFKNRQADYEEEYGLKISESMTVVTQLIVEEADDYGGKRELILVKIGNSWYLDLNSFFRAI